MSEPTAREVEMERVLMKLKAWLHLASLGSHSNLAMFHKSYLERVVAEIDAALKKEPGQ